MTSEIRLTENEKKVMIYLYRHKGENPDADKIASGTEMAVDDVEAALRFLKQVGYVAPSS